MDSNHKKLGAIEGLVATAIIALTTYGSTFVAQKNLAYSLDSIQNSLISLEIKIESIQEKQLLQDKEIKNLRLQFDRLEKEVKEGKK